ncbi:hypothetical protein ACFYY5_26205 [Nocardia elegans]|uniref:Thymidylate kinase-like domain-containing protein n=1 Tax=Nocardia elegans TaxID=300029 RepID=A0ABW6TKK2_9NOCA
MLIALEGIAGSGKTTLRDRILNLAEHSGIPVRHIGQFSWLSPAATRTLVAMRTGRAIVDELDAVAAVRDDLTLHAHHNIATAARDGHVLADRLILSSACLLGLNYPGTVARHLETLARVTDALPDLTVLVTTPAEVCAARLAARPNAQRVGDDSGTATRLHELYQRCADLWPHGTGRPLLRQPLNTFEDTEQLARQLLDELEKVGTQ